MNHHLSWPKQRDLKKDLQDVLEFCKKHGFYFHTLGLLKPVDPVNEANKYANYRIIRSCSDGDQHTYSMMEAFIDEDNCDCYKIVFDIPIDYYDLQTNLIESLRETCVQYNIFLGWEKIIVSRRGLKGVQPL